MPREVEAGIGGEPAEHVQKGPMAGVIEPEDVRFPPFRRAISLNLPFMFVPPAT